LGEPAEMHLESAGVRLNEPDKLCVILVVPCHGIEVHLHTVAGSDHDIAAFGTHRSDAFHGLKKTLGIRLRRSIRQCYFPPVVAMPLTRKRWPNRNTRKSGSKVTTDMANMAPQLLPAVASRNERSATGTV
jgi:hypothetical protein